MLKKDKHALAESVVARDYAIKKGVSPQHIFIETQSLTTLQNLHYAKQLVHQENISSVLLVSDAMHLKRALLMAERLNISSQASATPTSRYQSLKTRLPFALRELYFFHHYLLFNE